MYVMIHEYAKGGRLVTELSNDGREYLGELVGPRQVGERICAFLEVGCDDTPFGYDRLLESLEWLTEEIKKRKARAAQPTTATSAG